MKFETRIIIYEKSEVKELIKILPILYQVTMNQKITTYCDDETINCIVVNIEDSVYEDIIYRYVEVVKCK